METFKSSDRMARLLSSVVWSQPYTQLDRDVRRIVRCLFQLDGIYDQLSIEERHHEFRKLLCFLAKNVYSDNVNSPKKPNMDSVRMLNIAVAEAFLRAKDMYVLTYAFSPEHAVGTPMYFAKQAVASKFLHVIGETLESSLTFCEIFFGELTRSIQHNTTLSGEESLEWTRTQTLPLALFAHTCALIPWMPDTMPQKKWLVHLIHGASKKNVMAQRYLHRFLLLLCMANNKLRILTDSQLRQDLSRRGKSVEYYVTSQESAMDPEDPRIIVPDEHLEPLSDIVLAQNEEDRKALQAASEFAQWFSNNHSQLTRAFLEKCNQIKEEYLYAVRPKGLDSIAVTLSLLSSIGIDSISFHPEGFVPPDVGVAFTVRKEAGSPCVFNGSVRDFSLSCPDDVFENNAGFPIEFLRTVATYCIIEALHFITVKPSQNVFREGMQKNGSSKTSSSKGRRQLVRAMLRRLPVCHTGQAFHASERAKTLAQQQQGWIVPEGRTYVQEHVRGTGSPDESREPLFDANDELFKSSFLAS